MSLFKNGIGRPSNEIKKNRNIFKGICLIFGLVIIILVGYILNDKDVIDFISNNKKNDSTVNSTKTEVKEEILSDEEGQKIVKEVFGNFNMFYAINSEELDLNDNDVKTYISILNTEEGDKKYNCKELFGNDIESLADTFEEGSWKVENLLCSDGYQTLYRYSDVNKQYKKMFGEKNSASKTTVETIDGSAYGYSKSENGYSFLSCECGKSRHPMISGFKNVKKSNNILTVNYAEIIAEDDDYFVFNDGTKVKYDSKNDKDDDFSKYKDKIDVLYTLVFEEQTDGTYIFIKSK